MAKPVTDRVMELYRTENGSAISKEDAPAHRRPEIIELDTDLIVRILARPFEDMPHNDHVQICTSGIEIFLNHMSGLSTFWAERDFVPALRRAGYEPIVTGEDTFVGGQRLNPDYVLNNCSSVEQKLHDRYSAMVDGVGRAAYSSAAPEDGFFYVVNYSSDRLRQSKRNLHGLLAQIGHLLVHNLERYQGIDGEVGAWQFADNVAAGLYLDVFDGNKQEKALYRDAHLRIADTLLDGDSIAREGLVSDMRGLNLSFEVNRGLLYAAMAGEQLTPLCQALVAENKTHGE